MGTPASGLASGLRGRARGKRKEGVLLLVLA